MQYSSAPQGATSNYPDHPGYRRNAPETSREAADAIAPMARNHRDQILAVFKAAYPDTPGVPLGVIRNLITARASGCPCRQVLQIKKDAA